MSTPMWRRWLSEHDGGYMFLRGDPQEPRDEAGVWQPLAYAEARERVIEAARRREQAIQDGRREDVAMWNARLKAALDALEAQEEQHE